MIKTVGDIRKAIEGLSDEMPLELTVLCEITFDKENPQGTIRAYMTDYHGGPMLDVVVNHFCPDAYQNSQENQE